MSRALFCPVSESVMPPRRSAATGRSRSGAPPCGGTGRPAAISSAGEPCCATLAVLQHHDVVRPRHGAHPVGDDQHRLALQADGKAPPAPWSRFPHPGRRWPRPAARWVRPSEAPGRWRCAAARRRRAWRRFPRWACHSPGAACCTNSSQLAALAAARTSSSRGAALAQADVLHHRVVKEHHILEHHGVVGQQHLRVHRGDVHAAHGNAARR